MGVTSIDQEIDWFEIDQFPTSEIVAENEKVTRDVISVELILEGPS